MSEYKIQVIEFYRLTYSTYKLITVYEYNRAYGLPEYMESNEEEGSLAIF